MARKRPESARPRAARSRATPKPPANAPRRKNGQAAQGRARAGIYIENIALDVSAERLRRFFVKVDRGYQISRTIREMCIFAKQDLARCAPAGVVINEELKIVQFRGRADTRRVQQLPQELTATQEYLQSIIQENLIAYEEISSSNEEFQSTPEELETAKEELQSANEELTTVNDDLQESNTELSQVNNDLGNLLSGVNIPIVMRLEESGGDDQPGRPLEENSIAARARRYDDPDRAKDFQRIEAECVG